MPYKSLYDAEPTSPEPQSSGGYKSLYGDEPTPKKIAPKATPAVDASPLSTASQQSVLDKIGGAANAVGGAVDKATSRYLPRNFKKDAVGILGKVGDATETFFEYPQAYRESLLAGKPNFLKNLTQDANSPEARLAARLRKGDFHGAARDTGLSGDVTNRLAAGGEPLARAQKANPLFNAGAVMTAEFANPLGAGLGKLGGLAGKVGSKAFGALEDTADARNLLGIVPTLDRYRRVRRAGARNGGGVAGSDAAVDAVKKADAMAKQASEHAFDTTKKAFAKDPVTKKALTLSEKQEVFRRSNIDPATNQPLPHLLAHEGDAAEVARKQAMIDERAAIVRKSFDQSDLEQIAAHPDLLPIKKRHGSFLPMKGGFKKDAETQIGDQIAGAPTTSGSGGASIKMGTASTAAKSKKYNTYDERRASGTLDESTFDPATAMNDHLSTRGKNAAIQRESLANPLVRELTFKDSTGIVIGRGEKGLAAAERTAVYEAKNLSYQNTANALGLPVSSIKSGFRKLSPADQKMVRNKFEEIHEGKESEAKEKVLNDALQKEIKTSGDKRLKRADLYNDLKLKGMKGRAIPAELAAQWREAAKTNAPATGFSKGIDLVNNLNRQVFIANPAVHLFGNVRRNASTLARTNGVGVSYLKNLKRGFTDDSLNTRARSALAHAELGPPSSSLGGDAAHLMTSDGGPLLERVDRFATNMSDLNSKITFGGERGISNALFAALVEKGIPDARAGEMIRKALGDYGNVSKSGAEGYLSKALFFFPWLKGNSTFWVNTLLKHPNEVTAPHKAIAAYNNAVGAPKDANDEGHEMRIYQGKDRNGAAKYLTMPDPEKILGQMEPALDSPKGALHSAMNIIGSHATPAIGAGLDFLQTEFAPAADPGNPANFRTMFNKDAPAIDQGIEAVGNIARKEIPFGQMIVDRAKEVHNIGKHGFHPEFADFVAAAGLGTESKSTTKLQRHSLAAAFRMYQTYSKGKDDATKERLFNTYTKKRDRFLDHR